VRARTHGGDRRFLLYDARHDDEGEIQLEFLHDLQRGKRIEPRHAVIREDGIPVIGRQGVARGIRGRDTLEMRMVAGPLEAADEQQGVVLRVLDDQDVERVFFVRLRLSHCQTGMRDFRSESTPYA